MPAQAFTMTMTSLQKWLALLISLSIAIMVFFYRGYISKTQKSNGFLNYNANANEHNDRTNEVLHARMSEDIYEQLKHNGRSSDAIHDPQTDNYGPSSAKHDSLKDHDRPSDVHEPQKDHDRPSGVHEPLKDHDRPSDVHEPQKDHDRPSDVHEPQKDHDRPSDVHEPLKDHDRPSGVHEPLKDHDRPSDVHEPLKDHDRPSDVHEPQKDHDRPSDVHEPLKDHDRPSDVHEPQKDHDRPSDVHEPLKDHDRPSDVHEPQKDHDRPSGVHEPLKYHDRPSDVHEPQKDHDRPSDVHEPQKDHDRPSDVHEPLKDYDRPSDVKHDPLKDNDRPNNAIPDPQKLNHKYRPNVAIHEPERDNDRPNVVTHKPLKDNVHPNVAMHKPLKNIGRPNVTTLRQPGYSLSNDRLTTNNLMGGHTEIELHPHKSRQSSNITRVQIKFNPTMKNHPTSPVAHAVPSAGPKALTVCTYSGHNTVNMNSTGDFLLRVRTYNDAISKLRRKILTARPLVTPWRSIGANLTVLWGNRDDFLQCLSWHYEVFTVMLPWTPSGRNRKWTSRLDRRNVLVQDYYEWTATEPLCSWIRQRGFTKARWDAVYNRTCNTDADRSIAPTSLEPVYFHGKPVNVRDYWPNDGDAYPAHFYTRLPSHVFYVHLARDAVVTEPGDIISGSLKFLPYSCSQDTTATPPRGWNRTVVYGELFVMTQFWGGAHFHKMIEGFPRIAPYLDFLRNNEHVLIHAAETGGYTAATLRFLGINPERLVTGLSRAKLVYMPQSTPCGFAHPQSLQLLSKLYRDRIRVRYPNITRDGLVLVHRSGTRRFTHATAIRAALLSLAAETGLVFELYPDLPPPSMETSMRMFAGAAIVIAPHGAGLSNVVYASPGTYVVEAVCNPPHVNMCYQWAAHVLGMRYHALASRGGCESVIDVSATEIVDVVRIYAERAAANLRTNSYA